MTQAQGSTGRLLAGRYRLDAVLGRGGMGTVWRAEDEMLGRTVAVKELRMNASVDEDEKHRLIVRTLREAKATARIRHSSAVTVFDVVEEDDRPWIVMELVESRSLADVIREDGPLAPARAAEIALDVLGVLSAAHAHGILHRDVKPSNVLIGEDGRVVLTDFGIASVEGDSSVTSTGMLVGAPSYISPERAQGQKPGPPADLWSLGGTLYAMVEGRPPYDRGSALATLTAVMTEELTAPVNAGPLRPVVEGLLAKDPAERLTAPQTRSMLKRVVAEATARAESTTEHAVPVAGAGDDAGSGSGSSSGTGSGGGKGKGKDAGKGGKPPVGGLLGTVRVGSRAGDAASGETPVAPGTPEVPGDGPAPEGAAETSAEAARPVTSEWTLGATQAAGADPRTGRRRLAVATAVVVLLLIAGLIVLLQAFGGSEDGSPEGARGTAPVAAVTDGGTDSAAPATAPESTGPGEAAAPAPTEAPAAVPTPTPTPTPTPSATPTPTPTGAVVPAGYHEYKDPSGFSIVLPDWLQPTGSDANRRTFKGNGSTLRVEWTTTPGASALADWQASEPGLRGQVSNYQRVQLQSVAYREWTNAADWEWTNGTPRTHSLNRGFVTGSPAKYGYAIYWTTPDADWSAAPNAQARQTAFDTFQPTP
ncbi:serine/threonine-protein kinase [Kitasatospora purpeofusca]|uniref:serine/threonine-protein kinase n=1 Tax=Kitasatospora purpeofusca TaxID=67352 RepID=UPI00224EDF8C|nr:serine/threonine-protein kinase [Kitasatospora purpeofusca]MCX4753259.1 serine/threonine protein kinase [Kitasatospora purpeofusca]WSR32776.1 serine/threonine protein kinase [Kitasatospora purpeofusca]